MMGHAHVARASLASPTSTCAAPPTARSTSCAPGVRTTDRYHVRPVGAQGSHQLAATALADALVVLPDGRAARAAPTSLCSRCTVGAQGPPVGSGGRAPMRHLAEHSRRGPGEDAVGFGMASRGAVDLVDPFGRVIKDLRISVTDRCNFRCTYCMPEEGMTWLPRSEVLTFEEIERIAALMVERYGVESIRLTGGEPTVRARLPLLVGKLAALRTSPARRPGDDDQRRDAAADRRVGCAAPGCGGSTSASTRCDRERFVEMTRRDELDHVLDGIDAAQEPASTR